jgi:hypothetical protein
MQTSGSDPILLPACGGGIWDAAAGAADNMSSLEDTARQAAMFIQAERYHRAELAKNCLGAVESIYVWYGYFIIAFFMVLHTHGHTSAAAAVCRWGALSTT